MTLKYRYAPIVLGTVLLAGLGASLLLFRSSPGELAAPHQAVAGSSFIGNCRKCHSPKGLTAGCLSCHSEIGAQISQRKGYHGRTIADKVKNCAACHSDHNGKDFAMVNSVSWGAAVPKAFRHPQTKFTLKDAHARLACAACHVKHAPAFSLPGFPDTVRLSTFLGLSQACVSCHKDPHAGGKAAECAQCHTQDKFKPARNFDHDKFFPLRDAHAKVPCEKCHRQRDSARSAGSIFGAVAGRSCRDCHASPHRTDWGEDCRGCHTERAVPWSDARERMTKASHQTTGFRLDKPHNRTACKACHDPAKPYPERHSAGGHPRAQKDCVVCHEDPHAGQFPGRGCLDCHYDTAFKPSRIAAKQHASFYPLNGAHAKTACADCHVRDSALGAVRFVMTRRDCVSCHKDPHAGQFPRRGCLDCHDETAFKPSHFTVKEHAAAYPLSGAHAKADCAACHIYDKALEAVRYAKTRDDCAFCHKDPHAGQFRANGKTSCENCHRDVSSWKKTIFEHNTMSAFKLSAAHSRVACKDCHPDALTPDGRRLTLYKPLKHACEDCHAAAQ